MEDFFVAELQPRHLTSLEIYWAAVVKNSGHFIFTGT